MNEYRSKYIHSIQKDETKGIQWIVFQNEKGVTRDKPYYTSIDIPIHEVVIQDKEYTGVPNIIFDNEAMDRNAKWLLCVILRRQWYKLNLINGNKSLLAKIAGMHRETAEKYFNELIEYNIIVPIEFKYKTTKEVHFIINDLDQWQLPKKEESTHDSQINEADNEKPPF